MSSTIIDNHNVNTPDLASTPIMSNEFATAPSNQTQPTNVDTRFVWKHGGVRYKPVEPGKIRILVSGLACYGSEDFHQSIHQLIENDLNNIINYSVLKPLGYSNEFTEFKTKDLGDYERRMREWRPAFLTHFVPDLSAIVIVIDTTHKEYLGYKYSTTCWSKEKIWTFHGLYNTILKDVLHAQLASLSAENNTNPIPLLICVINQHKDKIPITNDHIITILELNKLKESSKRPIHIESLGPNGEGLIGAMDWLSLQLNLKRPAIANNNNNDKQLQIEGHNEPSIHLVDNYAKPIPKANSNNNWFKSFLKSVF